MNLNMFTLIALGTGAAYVYSLAAALVPGIFPDAFRDEAGQVGLYFEAAAVIIAHLAGTAPQATIDGIALAFVLSRVLFGICYIADWASARSLVWFFGMGCIVALFVGVAG